MSAGHFFRVFCLAGQRFAAPDAGKTRRVEAPLFRPALRQNRARAQGNSAKARTSSALRHRDAAKRRHAAPRRWAGHRRPNGPRSALRQKKRSTPPAGTAKRAASGKGYSPPSRESAALLASSSEIFDSSSPSASSSFSERSWREWNSLSSSDALTPSAYTEGSASRPSTSS